ncbi:HEXXH motif-containing putative peptide modification protein [Yinghuangia sp. ASG 101]|uniref:aKG-HExxH-type peptide beta-hydroxylase n=1 Tax=Yinghuangia sp. ASG 101 TaxID=2896848 RepID=UPI001E61B44E|nr:HEXXH motif-containing putative peptide modification protein [Yinghuangia sp. ASG 101]UGQ14186.1 HEXXH motif-containing putative peptide modification protein [Yinghuangia sp. ASG 101]
MHMLNTGHLVEMLGRFVHAINGKYVSTIEELRPAYVEAINVLRPVDLPAEPEGIRIGYEDSPWVTHCKEREIFPHIVGPASPSDKRTRQEWDRQIVEALALIEQINPGLRRMVDLLVTDIVTLNSGADGGGSANQMPGVVVMSPASAWLSLDYATCIVHEGLHTALFVLDSVCPMFTLPPNELERDDNRALSAVKIGERRPLHAALHAAAVAVPLMFMEHVQGRHALIDQYSVKPVSLASPDPLEIPCAFSFEKLPRKRSPGRGTWSPDPCDVLHHRRVGGGGR